MGKSIRLSQKHGVNPTIPLCFWCGQEKNEIALLGRLKGDAEAPRNLCLDYEPCDTCKKNMASGVTLMEAVHTPLHEGMPAIQKDCYPTGRWLVLKREAAKRMFNVEVKDKAFLDPEAFDMLISMATQGAG